VTARPISIRWISDVPSKIVKILAGTGRVIGIPARGFRSPCAWGMAALPVPRSGHLGSESLLADEPAQNFSVIGLFNGVPDPARTADAPVIGR
jgi:hypothetical protein